MEEIEGNFTIGNASGGLIVTPQGPLSLQQLHVLQQQILSKLHQQGFRFVVINLAGVPIIDQTEFNALKKLLDMCQLMGAKPILTDIHFGIASAVVQYNLSFDNICTFRTVEEAILDANEDNI